MAPDPGLMFNVSTLLGEALGSVRSYEVREAEFRCDEGRTPVSGTVRLTRTDGSVLVEAELHLAVEEICGRCLSPFAQELTVELREEFWPAYDPVLQARVEIPEGREGFPITEGLLDLQEALRQYVEMTRPMQPICRPDCAGDAGRAGEGLGAARAGERPSIDDRWAALEEFRPEVR